LSSHDDHSDGPSTLPIPELNPLLNPILGQNMGRWAEVYFTSPPEKRAQAVLELLRELQEKAAAEGIAVSSESPMQERALEFHEAHAPKPVDPLETIRCQACGWENPASHRFCGMCGGRVAEPLPQASAFAAVANADDPALEDPFGGRHLENRQIGNRHSEDRHSEDQHSEDRHSEGRHIEDHPIEDSPVDTRLLDDQPDEDRPKEQPSAQMTINESEIHDSSIHDLASEDLASEESAIHEPQTTRLADPLFEPAASPDDLSLLRAKFGRHTLENRDDKSAEDVRDASESRSYRIYMGMALAAAILALGYIAWRNTQATSRTTRVELQAPPAVATQPAIPAQAPPSPSVNSSANASLPGASGNNVSDRAPSESNEASPPSKEYPPRDNAGSNNGGASRAVDPSTSLIATAPAQEPSAGNGAEELAVAQGYLNGTNGEPRNSAEAAKWLWKSMAKHNATATLLLADLYLKGDGVAKNCDQARVLLDSAALRGLKEAGERLQSLQAFGCQ
jgi:hypothetical protein